MKDVTVRITDTLQFLQNNNILTYAQKTCLTGFARRFIQKKYPASNADTTEYKHFSNGMSMENVRNAGGEDDRHMRRAIYLLWHALGANYNQADRSRTLGTNQLTYELLRLVPKITIVEDAQYSRDQGARNLLETIIPAAPQYFLRHDVLRISGSTDDNSDQDQNLVDYYFTYSPAEDRYEIKPLEQPPPGAYSFTAASVLPVHWTKVPGRGKVENPKAPGYGFNTINGIKLDGSNIMVTTQFTGCSFCWKETDGTIYAAHIAPRSVIDDGSPSINGTKLARQLCGQSPNVKAGNFANFQGGSLFRVYGAGFGNGANGAFTEGYPADRLHAMYILGLQIGGRWKIFSQHVGAKSSVLGVYQLYPEPT